MMSSQSAALAGTEPASINQRREIAEKVRANWSAGGPDMASSQTLTIPGTSLRVRLHIPQAGAGHGTLLYLHGGGWMLFSIDTHDRLMREYAELAKCAVVGLDYSLAPEHRYPQQLDDVATCANWLRREASVLGINMKKVVIGGDSAGGNLSIASALRFRDRGEPVPDGLLLNYAAVDTEHRASHERFDGAPFMLDTKEMWDFWAGYLGQPDTDDPYARVLLSDLEGLPPTHLCIAECDILLDENVELARRLEQADVEVSAIVYPGATHSFLEAMSMSETARRGIRDGASWISSVLSP